MRLGLAKHDPAALAAVPLHYAATMPPGRGLGRIGGIKFQPSLCDNDLLPTCVAAFLLNSARATAWARTGADIVNDQRKAVTFYASVAGCADNFVAIDATDGVQMLTAFQHAAEFGFDVGQQVPLCPAITRCQADDRFSLAHAATDGLTALGVNLAAADRKMGAVWDVDMPGVTVADQQAGTWGSHCLGLWDWDGFGETDTVWLATWGMLQRATWRWVHSRLESGEAYAVDWQQERPA